jgi:predicted enzyme related to lactoylglutathione lyase
MAAVNAFVCTVDVADLDATLARVGELGGRVVVPRMPIPTVGYLAYAKDTEGNIFGMMQMDANAK